MKILPTLRACAWLMLLTIPATTAAAAAAPSAPPTPADLKPHRFTAANGAFRIDGQPIQIIAGEMHPQRVPFQFWEDRVKKAKAMGLNAMSLYVFWNQVEPAEGKFDFTGNNDIRRFVQLCQRNGLWVILRPGPYACAETEFGGYPAWLLKHHDIQLRSDQREFLNYNRSYLQALHDQLGDLLITHGGPIIMVQIENELGAINQYLADLKQIFVDVGFDGQLFTCDHSGPVWNQKQGLPGVLRATNGLPNQQKLELAQSVAGNFPVYGSEVYTSWFSVWGGPIGGTSKQHKPIPRQLSDTQWLLDRHLSFCFYMFDGGTNFGFSNGANRWDPVQTSYDYDAPIDELGRVTPKYRALRDLFIKTLKIDPPPIPPDPPVITIPPFALEPSAPLTDLRGEKTLDSTDVRTMEDLDQSYGIIRYTHQFPTGVSGELNLGHALDYSIVSLDGRVVGRAFAGYGPDSFKMKLNSPRPARLEILVYNLGRNSVGIDPRTARKGLNDNPTLDGQQLRGWHTETLPLENGGQWMNFPIDHLISPDAHVPMFYTGTFTLDRLGETYLDMRNWNFGVVWVNGHNLGRYWNVGADRSLYLPSVWQAKGLNEIVVLELAGPPRSPQITGTTDLIAEKPIPFTLPSAHASAPKPPLKQE